MISRAPRVNATHSPCGRDLVTPQSQQRKAVVVMGDAPPSPAADACYGAPAHVSVVEHEAAGADPHSRADVRGPHDLARANLLATRQ